MPDETAISIDDPRSPEVRALLTRHLELARAATPPAFVFALDVEALADPAVTFFSYRSGGELLAVAALKHLDDEHAEIKSMHTAQAARNPRSGPHAACTRARASPPAAPSVTTRTTRAAGS